MGSRYSPKKTSLKQKNETFKKQPDGEQQTGYFKIGHISLAGTSCRVDTFGLSINNIGHTSTPQCRKVFLISVENIFFNPEKIESQIML